MEHPDPGVLIHQTPPPSVTAPEGHQSLWICLLPPSSLCLVCSREDPAANPQHLKHVFENININRSAQKFFHLLLAKGSLCCSARLESVVTSKGFPQPSSSSSFFSSQLHQQITNQAVAPHGTYMLHTQRIPESLILEKISKNPHLTTTSMGSSCSIPTTPLPHCSSVKIQVPTGQIQRYFRIPLYFQAVSV